MIANTARGKIQGLEKGGVLQFRGIRFATAERFRAPVAVEGWDGVLDASTFGPIAPILTVASLEEAIELTNASPYGLLSAIFTRDLARGLRFADSVRTGWVNVNESSNYWESHLPFGGRAGSDSGIGRVGGSHVMDSFTELQTVVLTV